MAIHHLSMDLLTTHIHIHCPKYSYFFQGNPHGEIQGKLLDIL